jgi:glutamate formiminotransferase / 5-formyltetrahydrofolate cyclo-ligase
VSAAACSAGAGSDRPSPSDPYRPGYRAVPDVDRDALVECVVNVSEGRDLAVVGAIGAAGGDRVLDVHSDPEHHRSVLTLAGPLDAVEAAARAVVTRAIELIDLRTHSGLHPRFGAADVVPFVSLADSVTGAAGWDAVLAARDRFAEWAGAELGLPCFLYGPERSLPDVRRRAFSTLAPDAGPPRPHPSAGAAAVGARGVLVAYNIWLTGSGDGAADVAEVAEVARAIATAIRGPAVRALGFALDRAAQVSVNLVDPTAVSIEQVYDEVAASAVAKGVAVLRAELVGLIPAVVLDGVPPRRWSELDLSEESTIERRLETAGRRSSSGPPTPGH